MIDATGAPRTRALMKAALEVLRDEQSDTCPHRFPPPVERRIALGVPVRARCRSCGFDIEIWPEEPW